VLFPWGSVQNRIYNIVIEEGVTSLGNYAFNSVDIKTIEIPSSVTKIGEMTFVNCVDLESIELPDSIVDVGEGAFYGCSALKNVKFSKNMTAVAPNMFLRCSSLESIEIPENIKVIGMNAFLGCDTLKNINFEGVEKIEAAAFVDCGTLESITMPKSLKEIGEYVFSGCKMLKEIKVDESNTSFTVEEGVLFDKDMTKLIVYPCQINRTEYIIPDSVSEIEWGAFTYCKSLRNITIPSSVVEIAPYAFEFCMSLENLEIPFGVTKIGNGAFYNCSAMKSVTMPNELVEFGDEYTFYGCKSLESIVIPKGVENFGWSTFAECTSLKEINVAENNEEYVSIDGVAFTKDLTKLVIYPASKPEKSYIMPDKVYIIGFGAFAEAAMLENLTIPDSVDYIDEFAFGECTALKNVSMPASMKRIGYKAFVGCSSLESIEIPYGIDYVEVHTFVSCTSLKNLIIPETVTIIKDGAFDECSAISDVYYAGDEEKWVNVLKEANNGGLIKCPTLHYNYSPISVRLNSNEIFFDQPPIMKDERVMVPIRAIFEQLGYEVNWNQETQTAIAVKDNDRIEVTVNDLRIRYFRGESGIYDCDVVPVEISGRVLVPIRAISETAGCEVDWEDSTQTVLIKTK